MLPTLRPLSTLTALLAFTPLVTLRPLSTFATCPIEFRLAIHPCPRATTVPTLVLFCPTTSHIEGHRRGLAVVAFWPSFAVPHLAGRTGILPSFDHDVADVGGPDP